MRFTAACGLAAANAEDEALIVTLHRCWITSSKDFAQPPSTRKAEQFVIMTIAPF
jgi:hypothetical protein